MNIAIKRKKKVIFTFSAVPGRATPSGKIGAACGVRKINPGEACKVFNAMTNSMDSSMSVIAVVEMLEGVGKFKMSIKLPSAPDLLKKAANLSSGSKTPRQTSVAKLAMSKVVEIAKFKMKDMNAKNLDSAVKMIIGTAKSVGIDVINENE